MAGVMLVEMKSGRKRILSPLCFSFKKLILLSWAVLVVEELPEQLFFNCARLQKENFQYSSVPVFTGSDKSSSRNWTHLSILVLFLRALRRCEHCCSGLCLPEESQDHEGKLLFCTKKPHSPCCCNFSLLDLVWIIPLACRYEQCHSSNKRLRNSSEPEIC